MQIDLKMPDELMQRLASIESKLGPQSDSPEFWTFDQVAVKRGVSVATIRRHAREGKIKVVNTDFGRRIHRDDL